MDTEDAPRMRSLEDFRSYLLLLARMQLDAGPRNRIDPSDVVQQTLLEAHAKADQFHGDDSALAAWLRQALVNNLREPGGPCTATSATSAGSKPWQSRSRNPRPGWKECWPHRTRRPASGSCAMKNSSASPTL